MILDANNARYTIIKCILLLFFLQENYFFNQIYQKLQE